MSYKIFKSWSLFVLLIFLTACVSYEPATLVPAITLSPEQISVRTDDSPTRQLDFGIDATANESDSLFNLETLPGIRVRGVTPNGAADLAEIQAGDVILSIDDLPTNHPDTLITLETEAGQAAPYKFRLRRGTRVLETDVTPQLMRESGGMVELYRVDPIATRAGYDTQLITISARQPGSVTNAGQSSSATSAGSSSIAAARVREFFPESPLPAAGIKVGDLILSLNGEYLNSAQDLITRLNRDVELGQRVTLGIYTGGTVRNASGGRDAPDVRNVTVPLWDPGRRISRIAFGPLLQYRSNLNPDSASLSILDFWLFAVYDYTRTGSEKSYSVLGLFNYSSDLGELTEVEN
ncbi:MAG: PDZ domain-containing protein [Pseudohongiellaceae bacterium]